MNLINTEQIDSLLTAFKETYNMPTAINIDLRVF